MKPNEQKLQELEEDYLQALDIAKRVIARAETIIHEADTSRTWRNKKIRNLFLNPLNQSQEYELWKNYSRLSIRTATAICQN